MSTKLNQISQFTHAAHVTKMNACSYYTIWHTASSQFADVPYVALHTDLKC